MNELDLKARGRALNPFGELAPEAPSSATSRTRFLRAGMAGIMLAMAKGDDMQEFTCPEYKQYSTTVADWIDSLGLSGSGIVFVKTINASNKGYHFVSSKIENGSVARSFGYARLNGIGSVFESKAFGTSNDGRLENGAVVVFLKCDLDW